MQKTPLHPSSAAQVHILLLGQDSAALLATAQLLAAEGLSLALTCLCTAQGADALQHWGRAALRAGELRHWHWQALSPEDFWQDLIRCSNEAVDAVQSSLVFLLQGSIVPEASMLSSLLAKMPTQPDTLGLSPLLLAPAVPGEVRRVLHLGTVADSTGQLHYLYEGLPLAHPLCRRERAFQMGHAGALLVRREDYLAVGGLAQGLESLAVPDFCLRLRGLRKGYFSTVPAAQATQTDGWEPWRSCGLWNSLLQRGKLPPLLLQPDQHRHIQADGLTYSIDDWLEEGPQGLDFAVPTDSSTAAWLQWRRSPQPRTLLSWLTRLEPRQQAAALALCRDLPASLPHAHDWYTVRAQAQTAFARQEQLSVLQEDLARWQRQALRFHHGQLRRGIQALAQAGVYACALDASPAVYDAWMELAEGAAQSRPATAAEQTRWPEIAVLMPVWQPDLDFLRAAVDSVLAQDYPRWQLCLADDASPDPAVQALLQQYARQDARIRLVRLHENGHISRATNAALALADAPWCVFMDQDDTLAPHALGAVARLAAERPELQFIFSDEDKTDSHGLRRNPIFRAAYDPCRGVTGHLAACAAPLLRELGGLRTGVEGAQDLDLSLRVAERLSPAQMAHIPQVLYHWRVHSESTTGSVGTKPYVLEATRRVWADWLERQGESGSVAPAGRNNFFNVLREVPPQLQASVILLADEAGPLQPAMLQCLQKMAARLRLEVLWQPLQPQVEPVQAAVQGAWHCLPCAGPAWGQACRAAAQVASADVLFFLYAGLSPLADCRPEQLLLLAGREDVSMAGGSIEHAGRLWHTGLYPDRSGLPFPLLRGMESFLLASVCSGGLLLTRRVLAVSPLCMALKKQHFLDSEGFEQRLGPLAVARYALQEEARGRYALSCPLGHWELHSGGNFEGPLSREAQEEFLQQWGDRVARHEGRSPLLQAASDGGWTLNLSGQGR